MTVNRFLITTRGVDLFERPDGSVYGYRGSDLIGSTWHTGAGWRAIRAGETHDWSVASKHSGIAYLVLGCPDCVCWQVLCRTDDTGESCEIANCGFCLHGCSEDEHSASGVNR